MNTLKYKEHYFDESKLKPLYKEIDNAQKNLSFSCLELLMIHKSNIIFHKAFGKSTAIEGHDNTIKLNSIFDLASLTKPLVTATLIMLLIERGELSLYDYAHRFIENLTGTQNDIKIIHLLNHCSGLPAWHNLYKNSLTEKDAIKKLINIKPEAAPENKIIYSCLGYIYLKIIIEKITETSLNNISRELIFKPLNMKNSYFNPPKKLLSRIIPTGSSEGRKTLIHGEVNDDNAFILGGTGGNAGLFSTAHDIAIYSNIILSKGLYENKPFISEKSIELMSNLAFKHLDKEPWGLGFQLKRKNNPSCGEALTSSSFGHTGFTGTSLWIDPKQGLAIIILTNRVAVSYRGNLEKLQSFRKKAYTTLISAFKDSLL